MRESYLYHQSGKEIQPVCSFLKSKYRVIIKTLSLQNCPIYWESSSYCSTPWFNVSDSPLLWYSFIRLYVLLFSEEAPPPPPPPVVYFRYTDDRLRNLVKSLRERTEILREKAIDPYATSPEISPPVSKYGHVQSNNIENKRSRRAV